MSKKESIPLAKPFFERLKNDYLAKVGAALRGEASSTSIFPNSTDVGMTRESLYAEVLRLHLPSSCNVLFGGFLFGVDGSESKQIDLIITNDLAMQFNFYNRDGRGRAFSGVDGTIAVASIKSNLDSAELTNALENLASIPDKTPLGNRFIPMRELRGYGEWPYKIIFALDGVSARTALKTIHKFYDANPGIPYHRRPDLIHVAGKYIVDRVSVPRVARNGVDIAPNTFWSVDEPTDAYGLLNAIFQCHRIALISRFLDYSYGPVLDQVPF